MYWNNLSERNPKNQYKINRNMRCIEIVKHGSGRKKKDKINRNMRCIEMESMGSYSSTVYRLIETWDVLKF